MFVFDLVASSNRQLHRTEGLDKEHRAPSRELRRFPARLRAGAYNWPEPDLKAPAQSHDVGEWARLRGLLEALVLCRRLAAAMREHPTSVRHSESPWYGADLLEIDVEAEIHERAPLHAHLWLCLVASVAEKRI